MFGQPAPLRLGELHPFPVGVAIVVLPRELHAERLAGGRLGGSDVGLELDRLRACAGDEIDVGVGRAEASVVRLGDLGDDQGRAARPEFAAGDRNR